jgi:hypothetical protein
MPSLEFVPLVLTDAEREALKLLVRKRTRSRRRKIVQALDRTALALPMLPTDRRPDDPGASETSLLP